MITFIVTYLGVSLACFAWGIYRAVPLDDNLAPIAVAESGYS